MNLNDKNPADQDQPVAETKIDLKGKNDDSTNNEENNGTYSSITPLLSTSSKNDYIPASPDSQTSLPSTIEEISIYNIRTNRRRNIILGAISMVAFLLPFCDTMYLPALGLIEIDLNTTDMLVVISVSVFFFMSGICCIIWGPISDRFGRKNTILISLIIFLLVSLGCIFSPNISALIVLRALEGGASSATIVVGQSLVADIYPEETRGVASGIFFLPFNVGSIIGPLLGGPLSAAFGWRSTFIFLTVFSFLAILVMFVVVPETHHYITKKRFEKANPDKRIIDAAINDVLPIGKFFKSLIDLIDWTTIPYIILASTLLATIFTSFTVFPMCLSDAPYYYTAAKIGVLYAPSGVAMFVASLFGGWLSDKASEYYGHEKCPEGRLVPSIILSLLTPIGVLIYGWTFHFKVNVAGPIVGQVLICIGQALFEPSVSAYLTIRKSEKPATISALNSFFNFCTVGIIVTLAVPMQKAMGLGPYFSFLAGVNIISTVFAGVFMYKKVKRPDYTAI